MYKLSHGKIFATDYTNASRTMLFNIHTLEWDDELLKLFNIPRSMLPEVKPSSSYYGVMDKSYLGKETPICGVAGDQQASLFGHLCVERGDIKNTYGTGCFLLMNTGDKAVVSSNGLITTLAAGTTLMPSYVLEGSVFIGGAIVQWLRDEMRMIRTADESELYASKVESSGGVYIVPAFSGLGAPYWDARARGTVVGISRGTTREHFIRAALESIAYQVSDIAFAMERDSGAHIARLMVDGGASVNNFLMNVQADILNCRVERAGIAETTALGAAYLAGLNCGYWQSIEDIKRNAAKRDIFLPKISEEERKIKLDGWAKAVRQALLQ
jgi:glycerol kinase